MSIYLAVFGKPRYLGLVDIADPVPKAGRWIVIKTVRGLEMGMLGGTLSQDQEAKYRTACLEEPGDEHTKGPEPMLQEVEFMESAGDVQIQEHYARREDEDGVLVRARQLLRVHQLQMKLVDVEYTMDRKKLFFYFTSEQRIDFRAYVRDLAKEFRIRIEMRQIGVRDEAKTVRGISPCGRPCCCSYWLHRFTPINIRMVKEQNLALNPTKISGICGRLMCCMAYEHSTYSELWKSLPSPGSKIKTEQGNFILEGVDLSSETVRVRFPQGREVSVSIAEFANFKETVLLGGTWEKDVPEEPLRRGPALLRKTQTASSGTKAARAESFVKSDGSAGNKKFKPEKITIEEHIAGRVGDGKTGDDSKAGESHFSARSETEVQEVVVAKKRNRRRKSGSPSQEAKEAVEQHVEHRSNEPISKNSQTPQHAQRREPKPQSQGAQPQGVQPQRQQQQLKAQSSSLPGENQAASSEKQGGRNRRRPKRRSPEGQTPKQAGEDQSGPKKGDS